MFISVFFVFILACLEEKFALISAQRLAAIVFSLLYRTWVIFWTFVARAADIVFITYIIIFNIVGTC